MSSGAQKGHDCGLSAGRSVKGLQRLGGGEGGGCVSSDYVRAKAAACSESGRVVIHLCTRRSQEPSACDEADM